MTQVLENEGEARTRFGDRLAQRWLDTHPEQKPDMADFWRKFFLRAPMVLALISRAAPHPKIPEWEQQLSAGAVGMNIISAASALGIGAQWNTDWPAYDEVIARAMKLEPHERVAGFFYLGTPTMPVEDRPRPDPATLLSRWQE